MSIPDPIVLDNHGERMVPKIAGANTFWEHIHRYRFAAAHTRGKRVLDIACGEGYGAASLLRAGATSLIGMDLSELAVTNARLKYGIDARIGNALAIPLPDASVDVVVSFETVEHVTHPEKFIAECRRLLGPDGLLIISTPNKEVYGDGEAHNPHHVSEMTPADFGRLLGESFSTQTLFGQCPQRLPWWRPDIIRASEAQLRRLRGLSRARRLIQRLVNPALAAGPSPQQRENPVETILHVPGFLENAVDPYTVRPLRERECPTYLIAMARA